MRFFEKVLGLDRLYDRIEELSKENKAFWIQNEQLKRRLDESESQNAFISASLDAQVKESERWKAMYMSSEATRRKAVTERDALVAKLEHIEGLE